MPALAKSLDRIDEQLERLRRLVETEPHTLDRRIESVSAWSVRQQVDHMLKVLAVALRAFAGAPPVQPRGINLPGRILMAFDWIPRGVGKSPKTVLPAETPNAELLAEIARVRAAYRALDRSDPRFADSRPVFPHPRFGGLTARQGVQFLGCHTHHHWKIVDDIRSAIDPSDRSRA